MQDLDTCKSRQVGRVRPGWLKPKNFGCHFGPGGLLYGMSWNFRGQHGCG
jgi:hypothetical protein